MACGLSSGFSVTQAAAIYEGHLLAYTVQELDIGGQALTDNLQKLLRQNKGHNFNSSSGWQIVNKMKEKMAYVAKGTTGMEGVTLMQITSRSISVLKGSMSRPFLLFLGQISPF